MKVAKAAGISILNGQWLNYSDRFHCPLSFDFFDLQNFDLQKMPTFYELERELVKSHSHE